MFQSTVSARVPTPADTVAVDVWDATVSHLGEHIHGCISLCKTTVLSVLCHQILGTCFNIMG